jgi:hypothetical protein
MKRSKLAAEYFESSEFQSDTWNPFYIVELISAHIL